LCGWSIADGTLPSDSQASGTVNTPAAGATIASLALANGTYAVEWSVELEGTPGVGDIDNFELLINATNLGVSKNLGVVGVYPQPNAQAFVTFGPLTLAVKAVGAATAGAIYSATIVVTQINNASGQIFDGGLAVANYAVTPGGVDTRWLDRDGIDVQTQLSVVANLGTVTGILYVYLDSDLEPEAQRPRGKAR
jgi:hypothetical protein